jgi:phosphatidylinositol alpha-1,6-mannosyltransferase
MTGHVRVLALVTDAFGAGGGIAQYNRDFLGVLAELPSVSSVDVLPRIARLRDPPPERVHQHRPCRSRAHYAWRALWLAACRRPQLVFCGHLYMAPLALLVARIVGAKLVVQAHGVEVWEQPTRLQRAALERATLVLSVSRSTRAHVLAWASALAERVVVLPNTVGERFTPGDGSALREEMGLVGRRVLLSVSRLDPAQRYKGHDRIIPLIGPLHELGHDVIYLIGGSGGDRARLEAMAAEHGVGERVRFLGPVADDMLVDLYRAADLFLMPSSGEGFGIAFIEAMATGVPAVGLAIGGATDALGDGELGSAVHEDDLLAAIDARLRASTPGDRVLAERIRERFGKRVFEARVAQLAEAFL